MSQGDAPVVFSESQADRIAKTVLKSEGSGGGGGRNGPGTPDEDHSDPSNFCDLRITSVSGTAPQFDYTARRVKKSTAGYGGWADVDTVDVDAFNGIEDPNSGSPSIYGNGIVASDLSGTLALAPVGVGAIVFSAKTIFLPDGTREYWFSLSNQLTGGCDTTGGGGGD
jgi:hypothetical protein